MRDRLAIRTYARQPDAPSGGRGPTCTRLAAHHAATEPPVDPPEVVLDPPRIMPLPVVVVPPGVPELEHPANTADISAPKQTPNTIATVRRCMRVPFSVEFVPAGRARPIRARVDATLW